MDDSAAPVGLTLELTRAKDAGDPYAFRFEAQTYLLRGEDGSFESATFPWTAEMLRDLAGMQSARPDPAIRQRLGEGLRAFLLDAGWRVHEKRLQRALAAGQEVRITVRSAAAELYALPWELLTLGATGQHLGASDKCLFRYEWPGTRGATAAPKAREEGGRVLFAWSAAGGAVPASRHLAALRAACKGEVPFDKAQDVVANVSLPRLREALESGEPPRVLHVLCHGGRLASGAEVYGLVWNAQDGSPTVVDAGVFAQTLAPHAGTLRLVVLSACHGAGAGDPGNHLGSVAQALHRVGIPAVIASRFPLSVEASVRLTELLYGGLLGASLSLEQAFMRARVGIARDSEEAEWASLQLYARASAEGDLRPFVIRPYRGLRPFTPQDRRFYFGREQETARMLEVLRSGERLLTVVGASGSGKSSLVMAGIVPAVVEGALFDAPFQVRIMRPGARPCEALSAVLTSLSGEGAADWRQTTKHGADDALERTLREQPDALSGALEQRLGAAEGGAQLLLVVDQLEELASLTESRSDAVAFANNLVEALSRPAARLVVIFTVRADFLGAVLEVHRDLAARIEPSLRIALPMDKTTLREVIVRPAQKVGLRIDPGVTDALLEAVNDGPRASGTGARSEAQGSAHLPLLEFALEGLWERRVGSEIPWSAWQSLGGLRGALAKRADEILAGATSETQRLLARGIFGRLVQLGDGVADTRRYATRADLESVGEGAAAELDRWMAARLLTSDGADIAVAHEALIREWETLRGWIAEDREALTVRQELDHGAERWAAAGKPEEDLWRGGRLKRASELQAAGKLSLSAEEADFLQASIAAQDAEHEAAEKQRREQLQRERKGRRRARLAAIGAALTAVVMTGVGGWAKSQQLAAAQANDDLASERSAARQLALLAGARELLARNQPAFAGKVLLEVDNPEARPEWVDTALDVLDAPTPFFTLLGHTDAVTLAVFSPDSTRVATASDDWTARVWSASGRAPALVLSGHGGPVLDVAWSPDGKYVATGSVDKTARVWRADGSGEPIVLIAHEGPVLHVAWSPDGKRVLTASADTTARIWRADGVGRSTLLAGHTDEVRWATWTRDGSHVVTASRDKTARVWSATAAEEPVVLRGHDRGLLYVELDAQDRRVLTSSEDATARVFSIDGKGEPIVLRGHRASLYTASFDPTGRRVVTSSVDMTARVWNATGGDATAVLQGHSLYLRSAFWSPDGRHILTAAWDKTARLWNPDGSGFPTILQGHLDYLQSARFSPDGKQIVTAASDGLARVWPVATEDRRSLELAHPDVVWSVAFSPDGQTLVTSVGDNTARLLRVDGTSDPVSLRGHTGYVHYAAVSPDGKMVITASWDKTARLWTQDGKDTGVVFGPHDGPVHAAVFSPDGRRVVTACEDRLARVFDVSGKGEPVYLRGHEGKVLWAAWSPDGQRIATVSSDRTARIWSADGSGSPLVLKGHERAVTSVAWSPDGTRLYTSSEDSTIRSWSSDGAGTAVVFRGHSDGATQVVVSPSGKQLLTASEDRTLRVWNADGSGEAVILRGHRGIVRGVAWSPDGSRVASGAEDRAARLWDLAAATQAASRDVPTLEAKLAAANVDCLPRIVRKLVLDETPEEAEQRNARCENAYGRSAVSREATPLGD
jgi:WD40 repeat protein